MSAPTETSVEGPYFDELRVGDVVTSAPSMTLTEGMAAVHRSITGDRLRLAWDQRTSAQVTGRVLASPALVWDVAIGASTLVTEHVVANLFYRGLEFHRFPAIGDTLSTRTEVAALREHTRRTGRRPTGAAVLRITTTDQEHRPVLDFWRCAMLPLRDTDARTYAVDDVDAVGMAQDIDATAVDAWRTDLLPRTVERIRAGQRLAVIGGVLVSCAPELARLTGNVARIHHDTAAADGERLVYGGHTIGLAFGQICRAVPDLAAVLGWHGCDHMAPVHESDTLTSVITVERIDTCGAAAIADLRCIVTALALSGENKAVLNWTLRVLVA